MSGADYKSWPSVLLLVL